MNFSTFQPVALATLQDKWSCGQESGPGPTAKHPGFTALPQAMVSHTICFILFVSLIFFVFVKLRLMILGPGIIRIYTMVNEKRCITKVFKGVVLNVPMIWNHCFNSLRYHPMLYPPSDTSLIAFFFSLLVFIILQVMRPRLAFLCCGYYGKHPVCLLSQLSCIFF